MKRQILKIAFFTVALCFIIWLSLPENYKVDTKIFGREIKTTINPMTINTTFFGKPFARDFKTKLGLDLRGGSHLVFEADTSKLFGKDKEDALLSARTIIERRVNLWGASEPTVKNVRVGKSDRIEVDLPGLKDVDQAIGLIGSTAQLDFKIEGTQSAQMKIDDPRLFFLKYNTSTGLTGKEVKKASLQPDPQKPGSFAVLLQFNEKGRKLFEEITTKQVGKEIAIFLDSFPLIIPTVQTPIIGGEAQITGQFTSDQAKQLSIAINSGALPVSIKLIEQRLVGPTLGERQVKQSIVAGVVGLILVVLFMIGYYGKLGVIASFALINFALIRSIPIVLTLPGVAGFLLSIGMAVDSNILIFERTKEEMRAGKGFNEAVMSGFGKAIDAIKDANITTLLVAFILFNPFNWSFFPSFGLVKGFALTLAIGVMTSLFTGIVITKRLIRTFAMKKN